MDSNALPLLAASGLSLWVAALVATPRRPLPGNEVAELVYARLLGRQQRVALLALVVTAAGFVAALAAVPRHAAELAAAPPRQTCHDGVRVGIVCYTPQPEGMWVAERLGEDGAWRRVGVSMVPPVPPYVGDPTADP